MRITIDTTVCDGHGICERLRPDIFEIDDDGVAKLVTEEFTETDRPDLQMAVDQCPVQALRLHD